MKRAIGYVRVSSAGQAENGVSLDAQRAKIRAWCDVNDYTLGQVYTDAGMSGKRADNRVGLQDALQTACKKRGTAIVVYSLSRLARSTRDAINIAERLDKAGADLVSMSEHIDTTTAAGKMVFRMLAVLAEFERDLVSERTRTALAHKKANGERIGTIPFGWRVADDGVRLIEVPDQQRVLRLISRMRSRGRTYKAIGERLTNFNVPTPTGKSSRWSTRSVHSIAKRMSA